MLGAVSLRRNRARARLLVVPFRFRRGEEGHSARSMLRIEQGPIPRSRHAAGGPQSTRCVARRLAASGRRVPTSCISRGGGKHRRGTDARRRRVSLIWPLNKHRRHCEPKTARWRSPRTIYQDRAITSNDSAAATRRAGRDPADSIAVRPVLPAAGSESSATETWSTLAKTDFRRPM